MRLLIAAAVLMLATAGGAAYVAESAAHAGAAAVGEQLGGLPFGHGGLAGTDDLSLVDQTYARLEDTYYRSLDLQHLLDGDRAGLNAYLKARKVSVVAPAMTTSGSRSGDVALVRHEIERIAAGNPALKENELSLAAVDGMLKSLDDPYTVYLSAREINALNEELQGGDFGGIGVYIVQDRKTHETLVAPIPDNPAIAAGVKTGDVVLAVDGVPTKGEPLDEVERRIRGTAGTRVSLTLRGAKERGSHTLTVTRARVHVPSAVAKLDRGIEYVRLADFGTTSYEEVRKAMLDGKAHGAKGYVLDLRVNGGGLLDAAVQISSLFVQQGTVVATIDRNGVRDSRPALHVAIGAAPLVVLVDKYTASSSEITAGALQDYRVATIVGTRTFGKGVVQSIYSLPDRSALKITTARYVTPLGRDINKKGISPDVTVPDPMTDGEPDLRKFGTSADPVYTEARAIIAQKGT